MDLASGNVTARTETWHILARRPKYNICRFADFINNTHNVEFFS
jgi:hypothetical protein